MRDKNCRNCGAPLNRRGDCEYCGTEKQQVVQSSIQITPSSIQIATYIGDKPPRKMKIIQTAK